MDGGTLGGAVVAGNRLEAYLVERRLQVRRLGQRYARYPPVANSGPYDPCAPPGKGGNGRLEKSRVGQVVGQVKRVPIESLADDLFLLGPPYSLTLDHSYVCVASRIATGKSLNTRPRSSARRPPPSSTLEYSAPAIACLHRVGAGGGSDKNFPIHQEEKLPSGPNKDGVAGRPAVFARRRSPIPRGTPAGSAAGPQPAPTGRDVPGQRRRRARFAVPQPPAAHNCQAKTSRHVRGGKRANARPQTTSLARRANGKAGRPPGQADRSLAAAIPSTTGSDEQNRPAPDCRDRRGENPITRCPGRNRDIPVRRSSKRIGQGN